MNLPNNLQEWKILSEIIQGFGVGLGAFLGGLGGLKVILDWWGENRRNKEIQELKKFYNRKDFFKKNVYLVNEPNKPGWIFILDDRTKTRHWIKNPKTLSDLGYSYSDVINVSRRKFNQYKESNELSTS